MSLIVWKIKCSWSESKLLIHIKNGCLNCTSSTIFALNLVIKTLWHISDVLLCICSYISPSLSLWQSSRQCCGLDVLQTSCFSCFVVLFCRSHLSLHRSSWLTAELRYENKHSAPAAAGEKRSVADSLLHPEPATAAPQPCADFNTVLKENLGFGNN